MCVTLPSPVDSADQTCCTKGWLQNWLRLNQTLRSSSRSVYLVNLEACALQQGVPFSLALFLSDIVIMIVSSVPREGSAPVFGMAIPPISSRDYGDMAFFDCPSIHLQSSSVQSCNTFRRQYALAPMKSHQPSVHPM